MIKNLSIIFLICTTAYLFIENKNQKEAIEELKARFKVETQRVANLEETLKKFKNSLSIEKTPLLIQGTNLKNLPFNYKRYLGESYIDLSKIVLEDNKSSEIKYNNFEITPKIDYKKNGENKEVPEIKDLNIKNLGIHFKFEKKF